MGHEYQQWEPLGIVRLPYELESLPLVCQNGVRDVLTRLQKITRENSWFKIRNVGELHVLLPQVQVLSQQCFDTLKPFKQKDISWEKTLDNVYSAAEGRSGGHIGIFGHVEPGGLTFEVASSFAAGAISSEVRDAARMSGWGVIVDLFGIEKETCWYDVRDAEWSVFRNKPRPIVEKVGRAAAWETIKDQSDFQTNPYLPWLELYGLGAARINFYPDDDRDILVVDFPLIIKSKNVLGCLVFENGIPGDKEVLDIHQWYEGCSHPDDRNRSSKPTH